MESVAALLKGRRTIHQFTDKLPPRALIENAIDAARWVPNHRLTNPWRYYLLDPARITQIIDLNGKLVEAKSGQDSANAKRQRWQQIPGWLLLTSQLSEDEVLSQENYAACCCSVYAMSLMLWEQGIGIKWTTGDVIRTPQIYQICNIDKQAEKIVGLIWYGYPECIPEARPRHELDQILTVHE